MEGGARGGGATQSVIVAPDAGARDRARRLAACLTHADVVVLEKSRPRPNVARIAPLSPADARRVRGRAVVLVDDLVDTAGSMVAAIRILRAADVTRVAILATHAVFSGPALARLRRAHLDRIIVSDSLPITAGNRLPLHVVSLAHALTEAIRATYREKR